MSVLSAEIHAELSRLLQGLQSADNGVRSQAEEHLNNNWTSTRPEVLLMGLAEQIQVGGDSAVSLCIKLYNQREAEATNLLADPILRRRYLSPYRLKEQKT